MRAPNRGWRSARTAGLPAGAPASAPALAPAAHLPAAAIPAPPASGAPAMSRWRSIPMPWQGVRWSVSYLAFLVYIYVIITYRFPLAQVAMTIALLALPFEHGGLRLPAPLLLFGAYVLWGFSTYASSPYQYDVWQAALALGRIWLIVLVAYNVLTDRRRVRFYIFFFLGCFALYPLRGAYFNFFIYRALEQGRVAWNHIFSNPNDLSAYALLPLGLAAGVLLTESDKRIRLCALAGVIMIPLMMFLTQSRGAIVALAIFALASFAGNKRVIRYVLGLAAITFVVTIFAPSDVWTRLGGLKHATNTSDLAAVDKEGSAEQRFEIWRVATTMTSEHPLTGVGLGAYRWGHRDYARRAKFDITARGARDTHSTYLNILAETGIPGFLLFVGMVIAVVARAERGRRLMRRIAPLEARQLFFVEIALLAYGVAAVFGTYGHIPFTYLHLALLWVMGDLFVREATQRMGIGGARRAA